MSPSGNTSPRVFGPVVAHCGTIRPREHDESLSPPFPATGPPHSLAETRKKPSIKESNTDGANPSVASLGISLCNVPLREHQSSACWGCSVPLKDTGPRECDASPNSRFLESWPISSLSYDRNKLL